MRKIYVPKEQVDPNYFYGKNIWLKLFLEVEEAIRDGVESGDAEYILLDSKVISVV
jgi:hypothetical protein